jgi:putative nucleotidyltransferase with HDIG domain
VTDAAQRARSRRALACAAALLVASAAVAVLDTGSFVDPLTAVLVVGAAVAQLVTVNVQGSLTVSGAFLCGMLAAGFVGPAAAFAVAVVTVGVSWVMERYDAGRLLVNMAATATPTVGAAVILHALHLDTDGAAFPFVLAAVGLALNIANFAVVTPLADAVEGVPHTRVLPPADFLPVVLLNVAITAAVAAVYAQTGVAVMVLMLLAIVGFAYMARLLVLARERTREYANLSWGVLSGLIRTLDARDHRAARHCAAVARFSRDIARHVGMSERDQELAHTAGLLHDIGRFALSDRVMERGVTLTEADWQAIRRHPDLGADLLRDIGVYGPLSEIIVAHHERPDGKGYPRRSSGG